MAGLVEFLKPLNEVIAKGSALTEVRGSDFMHHLKTGADSLGALAWIAFTGKGCGKKMLDMDVLSVVQFAQYIINPHSFLIIMICYVIVGMSMPTAHVEESWQMAEFYCNKVNTLDLALQPGKEGNRFMLCCTY